MVGSVKPQAASLTVLLVLWFVPALAAAQGAATSRGCPLGDPQTLPANHVRGPQDRYGLAMMYLDQRCVVEARMLLTRAIPELASASGPRGVRVRGFATLAMSLVSAIEALEAGRRTQALADLAAIVSTGQNPVSARAAILLGEQVVNEPKSPYWASVESSLEELASAGWVPADLLLVSREVAQRGPYRGIQYLRTHLEGETRLRRALALRIVLGELLLKDQRPIEAQLVLVPLEQDAADKLLDLTLRKRLLLLGVHTAEALLAQGRREFLPMHSAYTSALTEIIRFVP